MILTLVASAIAAVALVSAFMLQASCKRLLSALEDLDARHDALRDCLVEAQAKISAQAQSTRSLEAQLSDFMASWKLPNDVWPHGKQLPELPPADDEPTPLTPIKGEDTKVIKKKRVRK